MSVSVLVLTKNEELDLPACLDSLSWSDDIHVLDSCSTDATAQIALDFGAHLTEREFDNWSSHQNWALQNIPFKHQWVYYSDADERVPPDLASEILGTTSRPSTHVAFRLPRRDYFMGRWLKHSIASPFNIRLFKPDKMQYERIINPVPVPAGTVGELHHHFDHFPFSKGIAHWISKHNSYSTLEAKQILADRMANVRPSLIHALFAPDLNERRRHQKTLFYRLPCRPQVKFLYFYLFRAGFLDGYPGLTYSKLQSIYEYMILLKTRELEAVQ